MGQNAEELRYDIERTRGELGETLDAIGDRVSPGRMIERRRNRITDGVRTARERVMGTVSGGAQGAASAAQGAAEAVSPDAMRDQVTGRPLGAGLVSFGLGFLVAAALPKTEPEAKAAQAVMEKAEPVTRELAAAGREVAEDLKAEASRASREVTDTASQAASELSETTKAKAAEAKDEIKGSSGDSAPQTTI